MSAKVPEETLSAEPITSAGFEGAIAVLDTYGITRMG